MNPRERLMATAIGGLMVMVFGYLGVSYISGQFTKGRSEIAQLEAAIQKSKKQIFDGQIAEKKIGEYQDRSLPASAEVTGTLYRDWLMKKVEEAGLAEPDVSAGPMVPEGDLFVKQSFTIDGKGTLPQFVDLLHSFYSVDWLHRMTKITAQPVKDSKLLTLSLTVEALSLKKAKDGAELVERPGKRLALASREAYHKSIVHRNLAGPPNNPPQISVSGNKEVYLGRAAEVTLKGTDPDPHDKVRFKLLQAPDKSAKMDEEKGRLTWEPKEPGMYEFLVEASDDGYPSLSSKPEKIVLNVVEQPREQARSLEFDEARYTVLVAVIDLDGQGEIWLSNRVANQVLTLHQGDQFSIGSIKGTVSQINERDFAFTSEGKLRKLAWGEFLVQAQVIGDAPSAAAATTSAKAEATDSQSDAKPQAPVGPKTQLTAEDKQAE